MDDKTNTSIRRNWEQRANATGSSLAGVLLRNLPESLNQHLHEWHLAILQNNFLPLLPYGSKVLDLASGYGRISLPIREIRPDLQMYGVDFVHSYCTQYITQVNSPAVCASIDSLPFKPHTFDGIIGVTALMYTNDEQQQYVFEQIVSKLIPQGYAFFLDPGKEYMTAISHLGSSKATTSGKSFNKSEYHKLGQTAYTEVIKTGGCPTFSLTLPAIYLFTHTPRLLTPLLNMIQQTDHLFCRYDKLSLHRWMIVQYKDNCF